MATVTCPTCLRCLACKVKITWELGIFLDPKKCCHVSHQNLEFLKCSPLEHSNATNPLAKCRLANIQILSSRRGTETRPFPKPREKKTMFFSLKFFKKETRNIKNCSGIARLDNFMDLRIRDFHENNMSPLYQRSEKSKHVMNRCSRFTAQAWVIDVQLRCQALLSRRSGEKHMMTGEFLARWWYPRKSSRKRLDQPYLLMKLCMSSIGLRIECCI